MEPKEIKLLFKKKKKRQLLVAIPLIPSVIFIAYMGNSEINIASDSMNIYLLIAAGIIFISGLIFSIVNWRCPGCNSYLGKRRNPKFCASCGVELR